MSKTKRLVAEQDSVAKQDDIEDAEALFRRADIDAGLGRAPKTRRRALSRDAIGLVHDLIFLLRHADDREHLIAQIRAALAAHTREMLRLRSSPRRRLH